MADFNQDARKRLDSILGKPDPDARIAALESENAELRSAVECCRACPEQPSTLVAELRAEVEKWRIAEGEAMLVVESQDLRLEKLQADLAEAQRERLNTVGICEEEVKDVRAENERLRKTLAGFVSVEDVEDALADLMHEDADVHKLFKAKLRALVEVSP